MGDLHVEAFWVALFIGAKTKKSPYYLTDCAWSSRIGEQLLDHEPCDGKVELVLSGVVTM